MNFIVFGSYKIEYQLTFSQRKTLGITVNPDASVSVKAPDGVCMDHINKTVRKKAIWILKKQHFFQSFQPKTPSKKYVSGETFSYLGRQYRLKIEKLNIQKTYIQLFGGYIHIQTIDTSPEKIKLILEKWYLEKAKKKILEIITPIYRKFIKKHDLNVENEEIFFRKMNNRWGSCSKKGKIILNPELIKTPKACIEYVMIHELCHLIHHNHSANFYELQTLEMHDWQKWKNKLEQYIFFI